MGGIDWRQLSQKARDGAKELVGVKSAAAGELPKNPAEIGVAWRPGAPNSIPELTSDGQLRVIDGQTGRSVPGPVMVDEATGKPIIAPRRPALPHRRRASARVAGTFQTVGEPRQKQDDARGVGPVAPRHGHHAGIPEQSSRWDIGQERAPNSPENYAYGTTTA